MKSNHFLNATILVAGTLALAYPGIAGAGPYREYTPPVECVPNVSGDSNLTNTYQYW